MPRKSEAINTLMLAAGGIAFAGQF